MRILKLILENYKSFQLPTEIDFEKGEFETDRNVFLVGGMNGAGKTSVLEAVTICLYGEKKQRIFKAINRREIAKGNVACRFELHLETDEREVVIVKRAWAAPAAINKPRAEDLEEKLTVIKDGKRVSVASQQMWQDYLDATLPRGITQFFFFDGEKIQDMAADEHSELKLKASMEAALGIEYVRQLADDLKHVRDHERRNLTDISDEDIKLKENELSLLQRKLEKTETRVEEVNADIQAFTEELEDRRRQFASLFGFEPEDLEEARLRERRRVQTSARLTEIDHEIKAFAENYLPLALLSPGFAKLRDQLEAERKIRSRGAVRDAAAELTDVVVDAATTPKPVGLDRDLTTEEQRTLKDRVYGVLSKFGPSSDPTRAADELLGLSDAESARVHVRLEAVERGWNGEFERNLADRRNIQLQLKEIDKELDRTRVTEEDREHFARLQQEIESYAAQLGRKREEARRLAEDIDAVRDQIASRERDLDILYQKHSGCREKTALIDRLTVLIGLSNDYIAQLREKKIQQLKAKTLEMYRRLASKGDLTSEIEIDPKTYMITIRDRHGHVVQKANLSAGEKEVFAISLLWGLAQTSQLNLPIIIDTPLSRLDSTHRDAIVGEYFPSAGHQVIVLSTDTEVDQRYYSQLEPHIQHAVQLQFEKGRELTTLVDGYFWRR